jgi:two-component system NtrC family sensor kinase
MLYVGFLETPFRSAKEKALMLIFAVFAVISLIGCAWSLKWAREIMKPISLMNRTIARVDRGEVAARVGETGSKDELGRLAAEFDQLLDVLAEKRNELQRWANELDCKVTERTQALEAANTELRMAQRQLVTSEKLAAIGELTAGVAHEINNPIAVIQGNLDILREVLGAQTLPVEQEIRLIGEQVHRIRVIVTKLLQFARPGEFAGYVEEVDVSAVLADCLVLAQHHLVKRNIEVVRSFDAAQWVGINRHELQQVLINLIVNAVQAMPDGGRLTLRTTDWLVDGACCGACIAVKDSGGGIAPDDIARIFNPFFTTKKNEGTGLGLSISHSLIKRYGGNITVDSTLEQGSEFVVWLLTDPVYSGDGQH